MQLVSELHIFQPAGELSANKGQHLAYINRKCHVST